ncbi:unknown [Collinsella sp. CAG:289]|nr:unknown [Collinsella sp. CAG:289]
MADTSHHGHRTGGHGARQALIVKGHKVLKRTASAHKQDAVGSRLDSGGAAQGLDKLGRSPLALNFRAHADKLHKRVAAAQRTLHVVDHRARKRRDHGHAIAKHGNMALARLVHKALATQFLGKSRHLLTKQALPRERETPRNKAHAPRGLVQIKRAGKLHL